MRKFLHYKKSKIGMLLFLSCYTYEAAADYKSKILPFERFKKSELSYSLPASKLVNWQISGKVTSAKGEPLPGVTVLLKGTTIGATTGVDGTYSISVPEQAGTLVFSFIGFTTQEKAFTGPER